MSDLEKAARGDYDPPFDWVKPGLFHSWGALGRAAAVWLALLFLIGLLIGGICALAGLAHTS